MPLYEYLCSSCKQRTEIIQNMSDAPRTVCPKCGGELKKLFSAPAIQFKGSGFYKTDYASSSGTPAPTGSEAATPAATTATAPSTPSSTTSSESKSDTGTKSD